MSVTGRSFRDFGASHVVSGNRIRAAIDEALEERMRLAQDISSLVFSLRKKVNIKVRQPLQRILIPVTEGRYAQTGGNGGGTDQIRGQCKGNRVPRDTNNFIKKKIKANFVALGKKLGSKMKAVAAAISAMTQDRYCNT